MIVVSRVEKNTPTKILGHKVSSEEDLSYPGARNVPCQCNIPPPWFHMRPWHSMFVSRTRGHDVTLDVFLGFGSDARDHCHRRCRNIHFGALGCLEVNIARPLRLEFLGGNETIRVATRHCGGELGCRYKVCPLLCGSTPGKGTGSSSGAG